MLHAAGVKLTTVSINRGFQHLNNYIPVAIGCTLPIGHHICWLHISVKLDCFKIFNRETA